MIHDRLLHHWSFKRIFSAACICSSNKNNLLCYINTMPKHLGNQLAVQSTPLSKQTSKLLWETVRSSLFKHQQQIKILINLQTTWTHIDISHFTAIFFMLPSSNVSLSLSLWQSNLEKHRTGLLLITWQQMTAISYCDLIQYLVEPTSQRPDCFL